MKVTVVGTGYVGLVTGTCFAEMGLHVQCIDIDTEKIERLKKNEIPIYEPGLDVLVRKNVESGRLQFGTDLASVIDHTDVIFSAVGTPSNEDGSADLKYVLDVARAVGQNMKKYLLFVIKSTVPVGTAKLVRYTISEELKNVILKFLSILHPIPNF